MGVARDSAAPAGPGPRERITAALAAVAPAAVWRVAGAFAATLLSVVTTTGGLFILVPQFQTGLVGGICAALIGPTPRRSAAIAGIATFLGVAAGPSSGWDPIPTMGARLAAAGTAALVAAVVAWLGATLAKRAPRSSRWLTWAVIVVITANVWFTVIDKAASARTGADGQRIPSLFQLLDGTATLSPGSETIGDRYALLQVVRALERGGRFYQTWHDEFGPRRKAGGTAGNSVVNYNLPTRFLLWEALPGSAASVVYAYLFLVSVAVFAVPFVVRGTVRMPLAIPGAAAVATYTFTYGYWLSILTGEPWAGVLVLLSVAAWMRSFAAARWKAWTLAAVALGVLAALVREPAALVPVAGLASAVSVRGGQRRFRVTAWAAGLAAFGALYLAHYVSVQPFLSGAAVGAGFRLVGVDSIVSALTFATPALGRSSLLPLLLAFLGLLGILLADDRRPMSYAGFAVALSLVAYLFITNDAHSPVTGGVVNYWGAVIVPALYACVPAVFSVVPGMAPAPGPIASNGRAGRASPAGVVARRQGGARR